MTKSISLPALLIIFAAGLLVIGLNLPMVPVVLVLMLPIVGGLATLSAVYLTMRYFELQPPRSPFFRMVLGSTWTKVIVGLFIGYLATAALGDMTDRFNLPIPGTREQRTAFIAWAVIILLSPPIYYAWTIYRGRQRANRDGKIG